MKSFPILALFALLFLGQGAHSAERPHVILIMVDDMGFSDLGYHGGEIETPNLDALAHGGVRFSQFYNSGRCCPTRATLMTGLHPHETGIGWMTQSPGGKGGKGRPPAYQGYLNRECVTVAEVLRESGYATLMAGKWHLGMEDKDCWPLQRGFEKFYGCVPGALKLFHPEHPRGIVFGNEKVEDPESTTDEAFYTTDAFTDYGIRFLKEEMEREGRPSFLYLAYNAPHWPLQAFEDDIAKYRGKYKIGWDKLREQRYKRQVELGLIDSKWVLSPRTGNIPAWESLDGKKRDEMDLKMAVYAAMIDRVDQNVGKLVSFLKESKIYDNTLILFLSDNGGCQEGGMFGRGNFYDIEKRNRESANSYGEAWANASNTPFRLYKHFVHEGGAATPFFMHWPKGIPKRDGWYRAPAQLIDVMPTILDVGGAEYPNEFQGHRILKGDGISLRNAFEGSPIERADPIFLEHENNASVREGDWKLVGRGVAANAGVDRSKWELYNIAEDRTETNNLAGPNPEKVRALAAKWDAWAVRAKVYPKVTKRGGGSDAAAVPAEAEANPPQVVGREFAVTAEVSHKSPHGVAVSHGGVQFGYALHFQNGRPAFSIRDGGKLTELVAEEAVSGNAKVVASLGSEAMSISVDGDVVATRPSPGLMTGQPAIGLYIGEDFKDPVGSYKVPNRFNGKVLGYSVDVTVPKVTMRTSWGEKVTAENVWREYPRPQMRRENWVNLNGLWDYAVTSNDVEKVPDTWAGKILVPFAIEAPLSGVEKRFSPEDVLWYRRTVEWEKREGRRYLLNFEAVDYESQVLVNGRLVGSNTGGNHPFSFDVTDALRDGENGIVVRVTDATDEKGSYQLHGKQRLNPRGIWYTPASGIWQTVWMEEVPNVHISGLKITSKIDGIVGVAVEFSGAERRANLVATASLNGRLLSTTDIKGIESGDIFEIEVLEPKLWSPESPTLYDLRFKLGGDVVESYVGIREVGRKKGADGHWRLTLNGEPIFHWGTLDQGWWPDGLLTPPSDDAMRSDIEFLKAAGFNTIRKHIKVEPRRYYHHCDKLGMMVWQDHVSSMSDNPEWTRLRPDPQIVTWPKEAHGQFMAELKKMMDILHGHPSIVQWVPFNERWGQHQTVEVGKWAADYDSTRLVNVASGGNFFPAGHIVDAHSYPHPEFPFEQGAGGRFDNYVKVMGEFGGHGFPVEGHVWDPKTRNWGYGGLPKDKSEWIERYRTSIRMLAELKSKGIAAGIYTQTTDVEGEINGLITYDRKVPKIPAAELKEIGKVLFE